MRRKFKIYIKQDIRFENPIIIGHFQGSVLLPRTNKTKLFTKKVKLPCHITKKWIKEKVLLQVISVDEIHKIIIVNICRFLSNEE